MSRHHADHRRVPWRQWARVRRAALDRDLWRCRRCQSPLELECHHVVPLAAGGAALALANLEIICRFCHLSAHMTPERRAWRELMR